MYTECTSRQAIMRTLCTPGVVYRGTPGVHAVYMPPKRPPGRARKQHQQDTGRRRWRANHIADWRKERRLTQQQVADSLGDVGFDYDRVSVGRVEKGDQNPPIIVLEAICRIVGAPSLTAMTDYTPRQWESIQTFISAGEAARTRALKILKAFEPDE